MILANDFRRQWEDVREDAVTAFERAGASGWYILGEEVRGFEAALASRWGLAHAVGVASGLDALEISLRILGCGPGDRVLTTPLSAFASTMAIVKLGAVPVFADTDERGNIDLDRCRNLLQRRSDLRYFLPVHLYGHPLDLDALARLRDEFDLRMVEDCAQALGARWCGKAVGSVGQLAATSFYPTKNLGAMGDGGAILTNQADFDAHARRLRFYGETARYQHGEIGYNSRLDEVQAAILRCAFLPRLERWLHRRRAIAEAYIEGIHHAGVRVTRSPRGADSAWHLFPVFVAPEHRGAFQEHLKQAGVVTGIHYPAVIPQQPAMKDRPYECADDGAIARHLCASEVSLPIHPYLTDSEIGHVISAVNGWRIAANSRASVG
jgi:dTDP-3-amino-3,4,6-trideoxy-alpha-D-glucose transaminase